MVVAALVPGTVANLKVPSIVGISIALVSIHHVIDSFIQFLFAIVLMIS